MFQFRPHAFDANHTPQTQQFLELFNLAEVLPKKRISQANDQRFA
jgi:hypothetical protein